jgi:S-disulfanyl-L-cysteine oxidoreductase SoxD
VSRLKLPLAVASALTLVLLGTEAGFGWPWSTDMYYNPSLRTFTTPPLPAPEGTLAIDGEPPMDRETAAKVLQNPIPSSAESRTRGRERFETFCFPCHGHGAKGDGPVSKKFIPPPDLTGAGYRTTADGYLYATIRNGGALMPAYGSELSVEDRWDIINFMRSLQHP